MKTSTLILTACLGLAASAALAATPPAEPKKAEHAKGEHHYCAEHAKECQDLAASFDKWCGENSDRCLAVKAAVEHRRQMCEKDKAACKEERHAMHEKMEEMCKQHADSPRCADMKGKGADVEDEGDSDEGAAH